MYNKCGIHPICILIFLTSCGKSDIMIVIFMKIGKTLENVFILKLLKKVRNFNILLQLNKGTLSMF